MQLAIVMTCQDQPVNVAEIEIQTANDDLCTGLIRWRDGGELRDKLLELEQLINDQVLPLVDHVPAQIDHMCVSILWRGKPIGVNDIQTHAGSVSFHCDPVIVREIAQALARGSQQH